MAKNLAKFRVGFFATNQYLVDPYLLPLPLRVINLRLLQEMAQVDRAGLLAAERGFVADVAVLAKLPDVPEIGIPATDFGKTDHLMGENHQRLPVLLAGPTLQQSGINADMSAADPGVAGNTLKETMQKR